MPRPILVLAGVLAAAATVTPAAAQQAPMPAWPPGQSVPGGDPGALASAALEQLIKALGLALQSLPQYDLPAVNERGDIIIKRKNPPPRRRPLGPDEAET